MKKIRIGMILVALVWLGTGCMAGYQHQHDANGLRFGAGLYTPDSAEASARAHATRTDAETRSTVCQPTSEHYDPETCARVMEAESVSGMYPGAARGYWRNQRLRRRERPFVGSARGGLSAGAISRVTTRDMTAAYATSGVTPDVRHPEVVGFLDTESSGRRELQQLRRSPPARSGGGTPGVDRSNEHRVHVRRGTARQVNVRQRAASRPKPEPVPTCDKFARLLAEFETVEQQIVALQKNGDLDVEGLTSKVSASLDLWDRLIVDGMVHCADDPAALQVLEAKSQKYATLRKHFTPEGGE